MSGTPSGPVATVAAEEGKIKGTG